MISGLVAIVFSFLGTVIGSFPPLRNGCSFNGAQCVGHHTQTVAVRGVNRRRSSQTESITHKIPPDLDAPARRLLTSTRLV